MMYFDKLDLKSSQIGLTAANRSSRHFSTRSFLLPKEVDTTKFPFGS